MKYSFCEKEKNVLAGLHDGTLSGEMLDHIDACAACGEAVFLAQNLEETVPHIEPPDASSVWRRAQDEARKQALAKATAPIQIARFCALAVAVFAVPWLLLTFATVPLWLSNLKRQMGMIDLSDFVTGTTFLGVVAGLICISLGSWYLLQQE